MKSIPLPIRFLIALAIVGLALTVLAQNFPTIGSPGGGNLSYSTNAIPGLAISWQRAYFTNIAANFTVTLAAPNANTFETSVMMVTNSSGTDFKVTMPAGVWGPYGSGTPAIAWCSNQLVTEIDLKHYGQQLTNMTVTHYAP